MKIDESWYSQVDSAPLRISAGGIVARAEQDRVLIALVNETGVPDLVLPKGGVEPGETLEEAARREILEEAGLSQIELFGLLGICERYDLYKERWIKAHYFLAVTSQIDGTPTDCDHHYGLTWAPLDRLPLMFWPEQRALVEKHKRHIAKHVLTWATQWRSERGAT